MKILLIVVFVLLSLFLFSCVTDSKKAAENSDIREKKPTSALATKLYTNFHKDPQTQAQKDENDLIDYAVDKGLDVKRTDSGMYYILHKEGTGTVALDKQPFKAHYTGYFLDGKIFDTSRNTGRPIMHTVGGMIPGWNEALKTFKVGSKVQLLIPSHLAYGPRGFPGLIPPNTPLVFDMEILPLQEN